MGMTSREFDAGQRDVLERIARGDPLFSILEDIVRLIENQARGMLCSILLYDAKHACVRHGAAPSLPAAYARALDGLPIGPTAGSCGAAIYFAEPVIAEDIATHPNWEPYRDFTLPHGLKACWSSPIMSPGKEVLGSYAMYYLEPRGPTAAEMAWVAAATHLAAVAILRHRAEVALRDSEERLRAVIEHTPDVSIQLYDEAGRILYCNQASERLFGWVPGRALGKTLLELGFFTPEEEEHFARARGIAKAGGRVQPIEFCYRRPDGSTGYLLSTVFQIPSEQTEHCFVCMDIDLTERRRMEAEVRASEQLRALIYESVENVIFFLSVEGPDAYRFRSVNAAFLKATGLRPNDVIGRRLDEVIPEPSLSMVLERYREALRTKQSVRWEEVSKYPAGVKHGEVTICPVTDADGQVRNVVGTVHDITERRQAEEERRQLESQLQQAQRLQALGTLASGIAHDFNNVLFAICANAEFAAAQLRVEQPARKNVLEIQQASERATELVRQILTFSRRQEPRRESLALPPLVDEALRLLRVSMRPDVDVKTTFDPNTPLVSVDATQIHQVIMNLGTNALHALGDAAGTVEVCIDEYLEPGDGRLSDLAEGRYARIRVIDSGSGMDAATLARAFDPFFTTKDPGKGTGLGLSVVHGILKSHGGAIGLESELGKGTTVTLYLPAVEPKDLSHAKPKPTISAKATERRHQRVLYVDEEEALVFLARRALERFGYAVLGHTSSARALQEFRAHPQDFDVLVAEVSMPDLNGIELAREVRAIREDMPVVMLTGCIRETDLAATERLGIRHLLPKPLSAGELARMLAPILEDECSKVPLDATR